MTNEELETNDDRQSDNHEKVQFAMDVSDFVKLMLDTVEKLEQRVIRLEAEMQEARGLKKQIDELQRDTRGVLETAQAIRDAAIARRNGPPKNPRLQ